MLKRFMAYVLNILVLVISIAMVYLYGISEFLYKREIVKPGIEIFEVVIEVLCPTYILALFIDGNNRIIHFLVPMIGLIELIMLDSFLSFIFQGDLAKSVLGLKIVSSNGRRVSFIQILARTAVKYGTLTFIPLVFIYPLLNKDNKTLHDIVAKTKVIDS